MNRREKILVGLAGGLSLLFAGAYGVKVLLLNPMHELDQQNLALREKLRQTSDERRAFFSAEDYVKGLGPLLFGSEADAASARAGKMLTDEIVRLGLQESQFSRSPVGPRKLRGAEEVGWSVQGEGPLPKMIDLLFVLEQTPQVHRLDNLVLSAGDRPGHLRARFRYLSLVVDGAGPPGKTEPKAKFALDSPQRRSYDAIIQRDLLRPYIPTPPTPAAANSLGLGDLSLDRVSVVSLSDWGGTPEVHVCDSPTQRIFRLKKGDNLAGGQIVMVDYRTLPLPGKPGVVSYSRVILKLGNAYWAVEHGQTLAAKYQLAPEQIPPELRGL